jgi:serine/threonine-protein kinase RsbW
MKTLKISSTIENLAAVEKFVEEICDQHLLSTTYFGNISIAVTEAAKNAILHGNKLNAEKEVTVSFENKHNGFSFVIEDQGEGFDVDTIPNPLEIEDTRFPTAGKGIYLIRSLSDKVVFKDKGKRVEMLFDISSINKETTLRRIRNLRKYFSKTKTIAKKG